MAEAIPSKKKGENAFLGYVVALAMKGGGPILDSVMADKLPTIKSWSDFVEGKKRSNFEECCLMKN